MRELLTECPNSETMKVFLATIVVVLALAHGSQAQSTQVEELTKYFQDLSAMVTSTTEQLVQKMQAETFMEDGKAQLQQIQEKLAPLAENIQAQLNPLADNVQAQLKPLVDNVQAQMEELFRKVLDQTKAITQ
uniref:Type-4 ice-structuring protein LS-12-like n=1 Tax=Esox lucius TaxID=8010 RepID=A0AAY5K0F5_ESOLU